MPEAHAAIRKRYPWYDSRWLDCFAAAREVLRPRGREAEFVQAMAPLRTDPAFETQVVPSAFDATTVSRLRDWVAQLDAGALEAHEFFHFGRHVVHDHPVLTELQHRLVDRVSELAGERVVPSYNFLSLYNTLGVCELHLDSPEAKWTLDVCIEQSTEWPLSISRVCDWPEGLACEPGWDERIRSDPAMGFADHTHTAGSGLLFSGSSQWHYRKRISRGGQQNFSRLAFFHYVPAGTERLVKPWNWAALFEAPELSDALARVPGWRQPGATANGR